MLISIIIPTCLRSECELIRAIDSVLWNGYDNIEIIVVNDNRTNSFDDFCFLISRYSSASIKFLYNTGEKGAASARNYAVNYSSGELITFLDDDDFILPGRLEQMYLAFIELESKGIHLISTGRVYQYENYSQLEIVRRQLFGKINLKDIYIHNDIDIGFMVRKSLFLELKGFDQSYKNLEDWDFIIRALKRGGAYKLKSFSYIVKNDISNNRVSNNDYIGLEKILNNYSSEFGLVWKEKIEIQIARSINKYGLRKAIRATFVCRSLYPIINYLGYIKNAIISK